MKAQVLLSMLFLAVCFFAVAARAEDNRGGFVMAFDDGYPSWVTAAAPVLKQAGGFATGFVNDQRIHSGDLSFADLRRLQNEYGWEIGTHTYHHFHGPDFVKRHGLDAWTKDELDASLRELRAEGLRVNSIVLPFNQLTAEMAKEIGKRLEGYRLPDAFDAFPVVAEKSADGAYAATPLDMAQYTPLEQVLSWIDYAQKQERFVFLYGHKVLPDDEFVTGVVASVSGPELLSKEVKGHLKKNVDLCLAPDVNRRLTGSPVKVASFEGNTVRTFRGDLSRLTRPGAAFMIGECYSMRLSYFKTLVDYAAKRLPFFTVHDALAKLPEAPSP